MGENYHNLKRLARSLSLHTVCESAHCPNIGECWHHKTATFMMLGNLCTRRCGFCAVPKGRPEPIDFDEPRRVAEAVAKLGLLHAVVTSVNRDDDNIGGARAFAMVIDEIRRQAPGCRVEVLIPDFQGNEEAIRIVVEARPEVLNHNTESVPRLYLASSASGKASYRADSRVVALLQKAKARRRHKIGRHGRPWRRDLRVAPGLPRSRGRGMRHPHHRPVLAAIARPSSNGAPSTRPREFAELKTEALRMGFRHVESGPLVRSSYHAHEQAASVAEAVA